MPVGSLDLLGCSNNGDHFENCLALDLLVQVTEARAYDLFGSQLNIEDHSQKSYKLLVLGLIEEIPSVDFGDVVMLRQLLTDSLTNHDQGIDVWLAPDSGRERGKPTPGIT